MKYKDPTTGDFKELKIRATDELPVGSEIDVDDNTDIPAGWEEIDNIDNYSLDEVKTNKLWVDGKPIYRKTIYHAGGSSGDIGIAHNISDLGRVVDVRGTIKFNNNQITIPRIASDGNNVGIDYISSVIHLYIPSAFGTNLTQIYITIEYTKTTD